VPDVGIFHACVFDMWIKLSLVCFSEITCFLREHMIWKFYQYQQNILQNREKCNEGNRQERRYNEQI